MHRSYFPQQNLEVGTSIPGGTNLHPASLLIRELLTSSVELGYVRMMAMMFSITADGFEVFDGLEARRRLLGRGVTLPNTIGKFATKKAWAEVKLVVAPIHPDARCATGEEFFLRIMADLWKATGKKSKNPVEVACHGRLFDNDFFISEAYVRRPANSLTYACPLMIAELDYSPEAMSAVVIVPANWVKGLKRMTIESTAWDAPAGHDNEVRGKNWQRRDAEVRLIEAIVRVPGDRSLGGYQASPYRVAYHDGALYSVPRSGLLNKYDATWKPREIPGFAKYIKPSDLYADAKSLWLVLRDHQIQFVKDKVVARKDDLETPNSQAMARYEQRFRLMSTHGGIGYISGIFQIQSATWLCTAHGVLIELRPGKPVRMYLVSNVDSHYFIASGAAFNGKSFFIAGDGIHEMPMATIEEACKARPANFEILGDLALTPWKA